MTSPPRVLLISTDTIDRKMAGPGIRYWNFARLIGAQQPVTLATPAMPPMDAPAGVSIVAYGEDASEARSRRIAAIATDVDVIVAQMPPYLHLDDEVLKRAHFVIDLYAPWFLEKLEYARRDPKRGIPARSDDLDILQRLLSIGDFFICASERQRDLWTGSLMAAGRLHPAQLEVDPEMRSLIDVVPMGVPNRPPLPNGPGPREVFTQIAPDDPIILWNGGLWNWLDPLTAIRAMGLLKARGLNARLIFMGAKSPGFEVAEMDIARQARALADQLDLLEDHVLFNDWVEYDARQNWMMQASMTLSLHHPTIESRFAYRTRLLDNLWCRLPIVATEGDVLSDIVRSEGLGRVVPPGEPEAVAAAIVDLLDREKSVDIRRRIATVSQTYTWERVVRPLLRYCLAPWKNPQATDSNEYVHKLERLYTETADYARALETVIEEKNRALESIPQPGQAADPWSERLQIWRRRG